MKKIDDAEMKNMYHEIERVRSRLLTLYFKMEESDFDNSDEHLVRRYVLAKNVVSSASDDLLSALDVLRKR